MKKSDDDNRIKTPGNRAFQTDQPLIIKGLFMVIPPYLAEQLQHHPSHQILKDRCAERSRKIEQKQVSGKSPQKKISGKRTNAIDRAERTRHKTPVGQLPVAKRHIGGFHAPSEHTVNAEGRNQTHRLQAGRHRYAVKQHNSSVPNVRFSWQKMEISAIQNTSP